MNEILELVEKHHGNNHKSTKKKLYKKVMSARLRWAKENNTTPEEILKLITDFLGKKDVFCKEILDIKNMSLDHIIPIKRGGEQKITNLTIVCKRCNVRKGILTRGEYMLLLDFIKRYKKEAQDYILRKLAMKDRYGG